MLYEANPVVAIAVQAGGKATNGFECILDIAPIEIHQRVPFYCGCTEMVEKLESFLLNEKTE